MRAIDYVRATSALWQHSIMYLVLLRLTVDLLCTLDVDILLQQRRFQVQVTKAHVAHFQQAYKILCI